MMQRTLEEPTNNFTKEQKQDIRNYVNYLCLGREPVTLDDVEKTIRNTLNEVMEEKIKEKIQQIKEEVIKNGI